MRVGGTGIFGTFDEEVDLIIKRFIEKVYCSISPSEEKERVGIKWWWPSGAMFSGPLSKEFSVCTRTKARELCTKTLSTLPEISDGRSVVPACCARGCCLRNEPPVDRSSSRHQVIAWRLTCFYEFIFSHKSRIVVLLG